MKKNITDKQIENIEILSKLSLNSDEKVRVKADLEKMLDFFDKLSEADTNGVVPMTHVTDIVNVLREDIVTNADGSGDTLFNAPDKTEDMFIVPITVD